MKNEIIIVGIILVILGAVLLYTGYQKMQPSKTDKTISYIKDFAEELSGEKINGFPKKDNTDSIILILLGCVAFISGLIMILNSRNNTNVIHNEFHNKIENNDFFCPNCGLKLDENSKFCSECGKKIG